MSFLCLLGVSALSVCSLCVSAQQRMCEQLTRVVDIVAGLPPFQATFEKAPVSEHLVIVMALGPYAVQSDTSGYVRAQFSKFAAANSADLLRLSLRCPLPGLCNRPYLRIPQSHKYTKRMTDYDPRSTNPLSGSTSYIYKMR